MIDAPQKGMIAILDEECLRPGKTTDLTFLEKVIQNFFYFYFDFLFIYLFLLEKKKKFELKN